MQGRKMLRFNWCGGPILEMDGLEDVFYLILGNTNISLCDLNARVVQNLIEKNQALGTSIIGLINISSECLSKGMSWEIANLNLIVILEILQLLVDALDGNRTASDIAFKDEVFFVWRAE